MPRSRRPAARCSPSRTPTRPGSPPRSGAWSARFGDPESATSAASFASRGRAARTRKGSTGATRLAVRGARIAPCRRHGRQRGDQRGAARGLHRARADPWPGHLPPVTSSPSEAGARCSSQGPWRASRWPTTLGSEFRRKRRMLAGAWATMLRHGMLSPRGYGPAYAFEILSHRALRYLSPILHLIALGTNLALLGHGWLYAVTLAAQIALLAAAALAPVVPLRPFRIARYYVAVTAASAAGLWDYLRRGVPPTWEKAEGTRSAGLTVTSGARTSCSRQSAWWRRAAPADRGGRDQARLAGPGDLPPATGRQGRRQFEV